MTRVSTRSTVLIAVVTVAVVAVGLALAVARHSSGTSRQAEDTFLSVTAAHLCQVGQTVYTDPKALADAYQSPPPYPGLTAHQVADLTARVRTDQSFGARLTRQVRTTCHQPANR